MIGDREQRPWGAWEILDEGDGYKVKRIEVDPHGRLSYQFHHHRQEHWTVVTGKASCVVDDEDVLLGPGDSLTVPVGSRHRICNAEDEPLVVIEVQSGGYTGEDDIVRIEDDYGR